jgi:ferric-dicitrate binding protein FerR (iron transport regulator)
VTDRLDLLVEAYLDGSLDGEGAVELARALRAGGPDAARIAGRVAFTGLLGQALDRADADAVVRGVDERLAAQEHGSAFVRAVERSLDRRHSTRARQRPRRRASPGPALAAAALVLVVAGAGWWTVQRSAAEPAADCRIAAAAAGGRIERAGAVIPAAPTTELRAGDLVAASGPLTLAYPDGTRFELAAGARVAVLAASPGKRLRLEAGELAAEVAPQPPGRPLAVATASARVEVVGTRFSLSAAPQRTRLELRQGAVRFIRLSDQRGIAVRAGETATVAPGEEFAARPLTAPAPAPAAATVAAAAEPPWRALFPATGLDGWTQQHGAWENQGGVVRGHSAQGGKVRLLGEQALRDLELTCRMRVTGVDHGEVQVGSYNWFFTVPARSGTWVALRLVQHGAELACTADGVAIAAEPGDGVAPRAGALAFYAMAGGTVEIADARIRTAP